MYIKAEKSRFPSFTPFRSSANRSSLPNNFDLIARSFDDNVLRRLKALNSPSISLAWISQAVDFLSSTHAEAQALVANLKPSSSSTDDAISSYLDGSVKLLDICNSISSEIERLRQRRLVINLVLHLLESPTADKLRRSRDLLSSDSKRTDLQVNRAKTFIGDLAATVGNTTVPRGKISNAGQLIRRTIYAVGVLTVFVAGSASAALCGGEDVPAVGVTAEFPWADCLSDLQSAMKRRRFEKKATWLVEEIDDVETRARALRDVVNDVVEGVKEKENAKDEKLGNAVEELGAAMERFSDGLDRLADGVNGTFRRVLCSRDGMLEEYRKSYEPCNEKQMKSKASKN